MEYKTTSREAIKNIKETMIIGRHGNIDVGNKYNKEILTIEKDLDVLDILKNYLYYDNKNHVVKMKEIRKSTFNFDYEDLKEWLEMNRLTKKKYFLNMVCTIKQMVMCQYVNLITNLVN